MAGSQVGLVWVAIGEGAPPFPVRFMVDAAHQGAGVGRAALGLLEDELRAGGWHELEVSFVPAEHGARGFWERCGFVDTGRVHDGEPVYRKDLWRRSPLLPVEGRFTGDTTRRDAVAASGRGRAERAHAAVAGLRRGRSERKRHVRTLAAQLGPMPRRQQTDKW